MSRPALPTFGGVWSDDPDIAAAQEQIAVDASVRRWNCGGCGCPLVDAERRFCRQRARDAWLWARTLELTKGSSE